jgi:hypothetical protein
LNYQIFRAQHANEVKQLIGKIVRNVVYGQIRRISFVSSIRPKYSSNSKWEAAILAKTADCFGKKKNFPKQNP